MVAKPQALSSPLPGPVKGIALAAETPVLEVKKRPRFGNRLNSPPRMATTKLFGVCPADVVESAYLLLIVICCG